MPNVRVHPYVGSDEYCERCNLPPGNTRHQDPVELLIALIKEAGLDTWEDPISSYTLEEHIRRAVRETNDEATRKED